jgi:hypothetical protein
MRYILHYTHPGDIVFDGFCGTGMTAVAAQRCGVFDEVIAKELPQAQWGPRSCVISDLSPEATFIAHSLNSPFAKPEFSNALEAITASVENQLSNLYHTSLDTNKTDKGTAEIAYTIWTEVTICPECGHVFPFSTAAVSASWDEEISPFPCPKCKVLLTGRKLGRFIEKRWDPFLKKTIEVSKHIPALINYQSSSIRSRKAPNEADNNKARLQGISINCDSPIVELLKLDRYYKDSLHIRKLSHVHHLYTDRTWYTLAHYWKAIRSYDCTPRTRQQLQALFTSVLPRLDRLNRYMQITTDMLAL